MAVATSSRPDAASEDASVAAAAPERTRGPSAYAGTSRLVAASHQQARHLGLPGHVFGEELDRIGYRGDSPSGNCDLDSYFELHIEQGPVLEAEEKVVGLIHRHHLHLLG